MFPKAAALARASGTRLARKLSGSTACWLAGGLWLAVFLAAARPAATPDSNRLITFVLAPMILLAIGAFYAVYPWRQRSRAERRYWRSLALGLGVWAATYLPNLAFRLLDFNVEAIRPYFDVGYALSYIFVVAALEARPDDVGLTAEADRTTPTWSAALMVTGLFATLVLLPVGLNRQHFPTYLSSFALYAAMDLYIAGRALYLAWQSASRAWRWSFASLGIGFALVLASDLLTSWLRRQQLPLTRGDLLDGFWLLPFVALILAGAAGSLDLRGQLRRLTTPIPADTVMAPPLTWALLFPVVHFAADSLGWLDPQLSAPRDVLVLVFTGLLLALALLQQRSFERRLGELVRRQLEMEEQLRVSENDLRLLLHRSRTAEVLSAAEERYDKMLAARSLLEKAAPPPDAGRERIASLLEGLRLPLRLVQAGPPWEDGQQTLFENAAARAAFPGDETLKVASGAAAILIGGNAREAST